MALTPAEYEKWRLVSSPHTFFVNGRKLTLANDHLTGKGGLIKELVEHYGEGAAFEQGCPRWAEVDADGRITRLHFDKPAGPAVRLPKDRKNNPVVGQLLADWEAAQTAEGWHQYEGRTLGWLPGKRDVDVTAAIWQVHFDDASRENCHHEWQPYDNSGYVSNGTGGSDYWFENSVIRRIYFDQAKDWEKADYVGVLSHKMTAKTAVRPEDLAAAMLKHPGKDAYWIGDPYAPMQHLKLLLQFHPNTAKLCAAVWPMMGWPKFDANAKYLGVYCNYWVASKEVFSRYVREVLVPVMDLLDTDPALRKVAMSQTNYGTPSATPKVLRKLSGHPWYTAHTFFVERLFGYWATLNGLDVCRVNRMVVQKGRHPEHRLEMFDHGRLSFM